MSEASLPLGAGGPRRVYDGDEVDRYVAGLQGEIQRLTEELDGARAELASMAAHNESLAAAERVLGQALLQAQQVADEAVEQSRRERDAILAAAHRERALLLDSARSEVAAMIDAARSDGSSVVPRLQPPRAVPHHGSVADAVAGEPAADTAGVASERPVVVVPTADWDAYFAPRLSSLYERIASEFASLRSEVTAIRPRSEPAERLTSSAIIGSASPWAPPAVSDVTGADQRRGWAPPSAAASAAAPPPPPPSGAPVIPLASGGASPARSSAAEAVSDGAAKRLFRR